LPNFGIGTLASRYISAPFTGINNREYALAREGSLFLYSPRGINARPQVEFQCALQLRGGMLEATSEEGADAIADAMMSTRFQLRPYFGSFAAAFGATMVMQSCNGCAARIPIAATALSVSR
jgi:hypothetical protein